MALCTKDLTVSSESDQIVIECQAFGWNDRSAFPSNEMSICGGKTCYRVRKLAALLKFLSTGLAYQADRNVIIALAGMIYKRTSSSLIKTAASKF